jgi:predicted ester cyclase
VTEIEANKAAVRRFVDEVMNDRRTEAIDELCAGEMAAAARRWVAPFQASFSDIAMDVVELIAEGDKVMGRFACSGTHTRDWRGHPPTGRRFERVDEVYVFRLEDGRIVEAWGIEDNEARQRQLGLPG